MRGKLENKLLKTQTGHLSDEMLEHYGDHEIEGEKELIQQKAKETFAGLLPDYLTMSHNTNNLKLISCNNT